MITGTGAPHVSPPSVEVLTKRPLSGPVSSKPRLNAEARFDGPKSTHGSVTRWNSPPARIETPWSGMFVQLLPPSKLVPKTRLREPPVVHRSSCHMPTTLLRLDWLTETMGSVSESSAARPLVVSSSAVSGPETPWSVETRTSASSGPGAAAIAGPGAVVASPDTPAENTAPLKLRPPGFRAAAVSANAATLRTSAAKPSNSRFTDSPLDSRAVTRAEEQHLTRIAKRQGVCCQSAVERASGAAWEPAASVARLRSRPNSRKLPA